tara:strand:+ start:2146 stop:3168 length:1023 start_codon:yes stop_codon:yes gene_type:complete
MGIKNFHKWLEECRLLETVKGCLTLDILVIDFHYILHQCLEKDDSLEDYIERLVLALQKIFKKVQFKKVGIFFDGFAPKAKEVTVKKRTTKKKRRTQLHQPQIISLTPGSPQLLLIEFHIKSFLIEKEYDYFISSSLQDGEGEIKMMKWIKNHPKHYKSLLYGGDSDLIPIGASIGAATQILLGNDGSPPGLVRISRVANTLIQADMPMKDKLNEMVVLCILLGNDYLPKLKGVSIKKLQESSRIRTGPLVINNNNYTLCNHGLRNWCLTLEESGAFSRSKVVTSLEDTKNYLKTFEWCIDLYLRGICQYNCIPYNRPAPDGVQLRTALKMSARRNKKEL